MNWPFVAIGEFSKVFDGPHATPKPADQGPVFLGIKNIRPDGHLDFSEVRHVSPDEYPRWTKRVTPTFGDVVFTYEATLHRYAMIPEGFVGCLGRRTALVRPDPSKVDSRFLFHYFRSRVWRSKMEQEKLVGATVDRIPIAKFSSFEIRLPPLADQRRIADILSAYDDLIENNNRRMVLLEESIHLLYREWFVYLRFPGHERTEIVDGVPKGWKRRAVKDVFSYLGGGTPSRKRPDFWDRGSIDWFAPTDLTRENAMFMERSKEKINNVGLSKSSARLFPAWSVMLTSRATIGALAINTVPAATNQGFIVCLPNEDMPLYFLFCWLKSSVGEFVARATGSTFKELSKGKFGAMTIVVPAKQMVQRFDDLVGPFGRQILSLQRQNEKLREARDLLLPRLMDGRIPV